jgi:hypothetical protein
VANDVGSRYAANMQRPVDESADATVAEARAEPEDCVQASEVARVLEAWSRQKTG